MIQLNAQQINALWMLCNAIEELDTSLTLDQDLGVVLEDLGFLPERDLSEISGELRACIERGEVGTREELLDCSNG